MGLSPAVGTGQITGVNIGRHLHATATLDAVECTLVAVAIILQFLFGPVANLDTTMFTNEVISLLGKLGRNLRFNLRYWTLHVRDLRQHIPQRGSVGWWPDRCR